MTGQVPPEVVALAASLEWLAVAQMLVLFHGRDRAWQRLRELGCPFVPPEDQP